MVFFIFNQILKETTVSKPKAWSGFALFANVTKKDIRLIWVKLWEPNQKPRCISLKHTKWPWGIKFVDVAVNWLNEV